MWVSLPHGLWIDGRSSGAVSLRAVGAVDEIFLVESGGMSPARRANALLARCIDPLEGTSAEPASIVRALIAGDREAILLQLRRMTLGDDFTGVFRCTAPACAEPLELELKVSDILLPPYARAAERYTVAVEHDGATFEVWFHLPTAGDQEDAAELARVDSAAVARLVFGRCVESALQGGQALDPAEIPEPVVDRVADAMEELDPQAIVEFELTCPACGSLFSAQLDAGDFLLRELDQRVDRLLREVHTLALCYHWSEAAILALPRVRRERYLELIASGAEAAT
jgi:hypothetical protein